MRGQKRKFKQKTVKPHAGYSTKPRPERALLAGIDIKGEKNSWPLQASLEELQRLTGTAGATVVGTISQHLAKRSPFYVGKGKLQEIKELKYDLDYTVVIFDDELSPAQQRNLERELSVKIIDRTALILDIFARHAHTKEGRLQVDLAQNQYLLPRLAGQWSHLERLGGGIGTRGPGESQLETDRRLVRNRIYQLQKEIKSVQQRRSLYRDNRKRNGVPVISLVGYTNAGKSTLMNALTEAQVTAEDKLFATLDPVTRKVHLPGGLDALLTDTVGFIQKLPTGLIAAFKATLEELQDTDILLHVVDISHPNVIEQYDTVEQVLHDLEIEDKPTVIALNKADLEQEANNHIDFGFDTHQIASESNGGQDNNVIRVSATQGSNLAMLKNHLRAKIAQGREEHYESNSLEEHLV